MVSEPTIPHGRRSRRPPIFGRVVLYIIEVLGISVCTNPLPLGDFRTILTNIPLPICHVS